MRVGIPKGLLYSKYHPFFESFFFGLGADIINSENTNKKILNKGVEYCVDEACLPIKIYHGHVASIKEQCDFLVVPRIMQIHSNEYICPKFCGLPEMIMHSIPHIPPVTLEPLYMYSDKSLYKWCLSVGSMITSNKRKITSAFENAIAAQKIYKTGIYNPKAEINIMLAGHPYIIDDSFINMNIVKKLTDKGIGIITEEFAPSPLADSQVKGLLVKPFWTFCRNLYGAATAFYHEAKVNGIIYLSSFACGIDSVLVDLIRLDIGDFPLLVIKLDEQSGEAGVDTRLEAFIDLLERKVQKNYCNIQSS